MASPTSDSSEGVGPSGQPRLAQEEPVERRTGRRAVLRYGIGAAAAGALGGAARLVGQIGSDAPPDPATEFATAVESPPYDQSFALWTEPSVGMDDLVEVRARAPFPVEIAVIRAGAETGRQRPRLLATGSRVDVGSDGTDDPAGWPVALRIPVDPTWPSGLYLAVAEGRGQRRYAPFVIRAADPTAGDGLVVQVPLTTYHAYNAWGGASLYRYNSPHGVARELAIRRPFDVFNGAGFLFYGDWQFARWLAGEGRRASWITSFDLHRDPTVVERARLFVSVFHDEYWSTPMRQTLEGFVASGGNAAFFAANSIYWRIRLTDSTLTCHKARQWSDDPHTDITATWRHDLVGRPEAELLGSQYVDYVRYGAGYDWTVTAADHWIYRGTGLRDGDRIAGLVGYEWDHAPDADLAGLTVLARTGIVTPDGEQRRHEATEVRHQGGGTVVNVGTNYWPRFLLGDAAFRADRRVQRMTANVLDRLGGR